MSEEEKLLVEGECVGICETLKSLRKLVRSQYTPQSRPSSKFQVRLFTLIQLQYNNNKE